MNASLPIVIIPGIQGHWEWMKPAIAALRQTREVRTFSLSAENGDGDPFAMRNTLQDAGEVCLEGRNAQLADAHRKPWRLIAIAVPSGDTI